MFCKYFCFFSQKLIFEFPEFLKFKIISKKVWKNREWFDSWNLDLTN